MHKGESDEHPSSLSLARIGPLIAVPVLSLAGTEQSASDSKNSTRSVGSTGQVKNNSSSVNDTNAQALPPSAASTVGDRQTAPDSEGCVLLQWSKKGFSGARSHSAAPYPDPEPGGACTARSKT